MDPIKNAFVTENSMLDLKCMISSQIMKIQLKYVCQILDSKMGANFQVKSQSVLMPCSSIDMFGGLLNILIDTESLLFVCKAVAADDDSQSRTDFFGQFLNKEFRLISDLIKYSMSYIVMCSIG
jgi:hypothetical protein